MIKSPINVTLNNMIEDKIISSMEKISNVLKGLLWDVAKEEGISPLQIQFLLYISTHSRKPVKVGDIAREFQLTDATTSDSISALVAKGLLKKERDTQDSRKVYLHLTNKGKEVVRRVKKWKLPIKSILRKVNEEEKKALFITLLEIIKEFQEKGLVKVAKICLTCTHLTIRKTNGEKLYYCSLTNTELSPSTLKLDCNFFEKKKCKPIKNLSKKEKLENI